MITIESINQQGYIDYFDKFGNYDFDGIPELLALPQMPVPYVKELGQVLGKCAKENRKATAKEVVDALYLNKDGFYQAFHISEKNYREFIKQIKKLDKKLIV